MIYLLALFIILVRIFIIYKELIVHTELYN